MFVLNQNGKWMLHQDLIKLLLWFWINIIISFKTYKLMVKNSLIIKI